MIFPTFIEFFYDKKQAQDCRLSVNTVHLAPLTNEQYTFVLPDGYNSVNGIFIIHNGKELTSFANSSLNIVNGKTLFTVSNIDFDNWDFIQLKLTSIEFEPVYSQKIRVSSEDLERTTLVQFMSNKWNLIGGMRLNLFKVQNKRLHENTTYYQFSKERTISTGAKRNYVEKYHIENIHTDVANAFVDVLTLPIIYFDGIRTYINELPEFEDLKGGENFVSSYVIVNKNHSDTIETNSLINTKVLGNRQFNEILGNSNNDEILGNGN